MGGISVQQDRICAYETLKIAKQYLQYIPSDEKEYFENIISNRIKTFCFSQILSEYADDFARFIKNRMDESGREKIVIFGAGNWGMKSCSILVSRGIKIQFIVDNNRERWGTFNEGIEIKSPEALYTFKGIVLLLIRGFTKEILQQVQRMDKADIDCITWEEIAMIREDRI